MTKLEHALSWAHAGWHVFPCMPGAKRPDPELAPHGVKDATTDEAVIRAWWSIKPDANIGGTRGLVVDCDIKGEANGLVAFRAWLDHRGLDGNAIVAGARRHRSPSGGLHVIFDTSEALAQPDLIAGLVNIRTGGMGYVCLPGSTVVVDGIELGYVAEHDVEPGPAPGPLVLHCRQHERKIGKVDIESLDRPAQVAKAAAFLKNCPPSIQGHGGDNHAYRTAQEVLDMHIAPLTCLQLMHEHFNPRCRPPDADWITTKVANAASYRQNSIGHSQMGTGAWSPGMKALMQWSASNPADDPEEEEARPPSVGMFRTAQELIGQPAPKYLVDLIIPERSITMVYGGTKAGKSLLALDLALHMATGHEAWAGLKLRPGRVVYFTGEGNLFLGGRVKAWLEHHGADAPSPDLFEWVDFVPRLGEETFVGDALDAIRGLTERRAAGAPVRLAIMDTLEMGTLDIIDPAEAVRFMQRVRVVTEEADCAVLLVHHQNKEEKARGSRVYMHQVDGSLRLELATTQHDPERLLFSDVHRSSRGLGELPKGFTITEVETGVDGAPVTDALMVFDPRAEAAAEAARDAERARTVVDAHTADKWIAAIIEVIEEEQRDFGGNAESHRQLLELASLRIATAEGIDELPIGDTKKTNGPYYKLWCSWPDHPKLKPYVQGRWQGRKTYPIIGPIPPAERRVR